MILGLDVITLLVRNLDEAVRFYTEAFGFEKRTDVSMPDGYRWVTVGVPGQVGAGLTLQLANSEAERQAVGNQAGGHVLFVLTTDNCQADYAALKARGVKFSDAPAQRPYGVEAIFEDLYGNRFDLLQPAMRAFSS